MAYDKKAAIQAAREEKKRMEEEIQDAIESWAINPDALIEFFQFSEKFSYQYSFRNTLLIQRQNEGAAFCQSFDAWKKAGYSVLKGMHGMSIYVPVQATILEVDGKDIPLAEASEQQRRDYKEGKLSSKTALHYRIGKTFDVAQTNFPPEKYPELLSRGIPSDKHKICIDAIRAYMEEVLKIPVIMEAENLKGTKAGDVQYGIQGASLYGFYHPGEEKRDIHIAHTLQDTAALSTLTHEMGHAVAQHCRSESSNIHQIEFEADAFSIMLQTHFGVPITDERKSHISNEYKRWQLDEKENFHPEKSLDKMFSLYRLHIEGIDQRLKKYLPEEKEEIQPQQQIQKKNKKVGRRL